MAMVCGLKKGLVQWGFNYACPQHHNLGQSSCLRLYNY